MSDHVIGGDAPPWQQLSWNLQRNRRNMLVALLGCTVLFGGTALVMPAAYRSNSELMVRLGQEYLVGTSKNTLPRRGCNEIPSPCVFRRDVLWGR
jgi:uncharacterized protein involved in exopolysaccharide biosynthesis